MEKTASCNFTKYIKRGPNRWQHCPVVRGKTGRVKQDLVLVDGRIEHHPEGYYSLDWREGGRRHRTSLGKDATAAQLTLERRVAMQRALAIGITVSEDQCAVSFGVEEACKEFLDETRVQRSPATFKQYRTALAYFQESCGRHRLDQIDRRTLLDSRLFLAAEKKLSPRTIWAKMMVVEQMLKTHGRNKLLRRGDWPRYVERIPHTDLSSYVGRVEPVTDRPDIRATVDLTVALFQSICPKRGLYRPTFRKNGEPGTPLRRLSGLEMENRIDSYSSREEPLLLGLRDGLEILTDVHPQPEVSLISGRNCGRDRL